MCDLSSLSKDELLELISLRNFQYSVSESDVQRAQQNVLFREGKRMMDETCQEIKKYHGPQNWAKYKKQMDKFDKGMAIIDQANKLMISKSS